MFVLTLLLIALRKTKEEDSEKILELKELQKQLLTLKTLQTSKLDADSFKKSHDSTFDSIKGVFSSATDIFVHFVPLYKKVHDEEKFHQNWNMACDKIQSLLNQYGLQADDKIAYLKRHKNENGWDVDSDALQIVALQDCSKDIGIDFSVLNFLYLNCKGEITTVMWKQFKEDTQRLILLSKILYNSEQIDFDKESISKI